MQHVVAETMSVVDQRSSRVTRTETASLLRPEFSEVAAKLLQLQVPTSAVSFKPSQAGQIRLTAWLLSPLPPQITTCSSPKCGTTVQTHPCSPTPMHKMYSAQVGSRQHTDMATTCCATHPPSCKNHLLHVAAGASCAIGSWLLVL
jgi:hypothetical protein